MWENACNKALIAYRYNMTNYCRSAKFKSRAVYVAQIMHLNVSGNIYLNQFRRCPELVQFG